MIKFEKFNLKDYADCFVITDKNIAELYGICGDNVFLLPCGEKAKTFFHAQKICEWLLSQAAQKDDTVVAVGGGSIGDVVGFAASIFKRGINLLHVPTTLLAQIDSGIGGKTAVDLGEVKNAVGTFYAADTLIDTQFLRTLPKKQLKSGFGEVLKYRMLSADVDAVAVGAKFNLNSDAFLQWDAVSELVRACATYKQKICDIDPFDKGQRRLLNFGHTIGHAMELAKKIPHGEAVANGIFYETCIAEKFGMVDADYADKWQKEAKKLFRLCPINEKIMQLMRHDKKNKNGNICVILPTADGFCERFFTFEEMAEFFGFKYLC